MSTKPKFLLVPLGIIGGAIADGALVLFWTIHKDHQLPVHVKTYMSQVAVWPWVGTLFGFAFGVMMSIGMRKLRTLSGHQIVPFAVFVAIGQFFIPFAFSFLWPLIKVPGIPPIVIVNALYALLIALLARGALLLDIGFLGILVTALVGAAVTYAPAFGGVLKWGPSVWYTVVALSVAFFSAINVPKSRFVLKGQAYR